MTTMPESGAATVGNLQDLLRLVLPAFVGEDEKALQKYGPPETRWNVAQAAIQNLQSCLHSEEACEFAREYGPATIEDLQLLVYEHTDGMGWIDWNDTNAENGIAVHANDFCTLLVYPFSLDEFWATLDKLEAETRHDIETQGFCDLCRAGQHEDCARNVPGGTEDMCVCEGNCQDLLSDLEQAREYLELLQNHLRDEAP